MTVATGLKPPSVFETDATSIKRSTMSKDRVEDFDAATNGRRVTRQGDLTAAGGRRRGWRSRRGCRRVVNDRTMRQASPTDGDVFNVCFCFCLMFLMFYPKTDDNASFVADAESD